ncbi:MAG: 4Fe-4S binding protein [Candidatus Melainabacteria bacterium]|nr:4Fe-4S binding protein [Candidatus Melainabacteria bacterium]
MTHFIHVECVGCGACRRVCPVSCIDGSPKELHVIEPSRCIDCGACGIVCPVSCIADPTGKRYQFLKPKERPWAEVEQTICSGCQYCVDICPFECLEIVASPDEGYATALAVNAHKNHCVSCKLCVSVCPKETISIVYPEAGGEKKRSA